MARGTTLSELVAMVRSEANLGSNTALITDKIEQIKHAIRRTQQNLYDGHDWPFLRVRASKSMVVGSYRYDFPTTVNPERIERVDVLWNGTYTPIDRGIDAENYNSYNSDSDERADPVLAWEWYTNGTSTQFEVWPIPATSGGAVRFSGMRPLRALLADADVADLDDYLIASTTAIDFTTGETQKKVAAQAARRLALLVGNLTGGTRIRTLSGYPGREVRNQGSTVRVSGA